MAVSSEEKEARKAAQQEAAERDAAKKDAAQAAKLAEIAKAKEEEALKQAKRKK